MSEWMPYVVSIFCAVLSAVVSIVVCLVQIKAAKNEANTKYEREKELLQKDYDSKIEAIRKEIAYKAGAQMLTDVTNNALNAVLDSPAMKNEINRQTAQRIRNRNSNKNNGKHR